MLVCKEDVSTDKRTCVTSRSSRESRGRERGYVRYSGPKRSKVDQAGEGEGVSHVVANQVDQQGV